ncbi:PmoA family protein [Kitasatospora paranensis]|uniref:PmoA family protein n=1 Tax=Kitasatospora paranensis TaxID=258053 RepID=A0ABW2FUW4_9ACTN
MDVRTEAGTEVGTTVRTAVRTEDDGAAVTFEAAGVQLLRYVYPGDPEPAESPKPYIHPLRTLAGDVVTAYRPHDHRWHKGLQLTASYLSGENFWGGGSYVRELGRYADVDNHGSIRHDAFEAVGDGRVDERLSWLSRAGEPWLTERRRITAAVLGDDVWELVWSTELTALRGEPLRFGSPTTQGRPLAGYSGLVWRGPRSFTDGEVIGPDGGGEELMGRPGPWLAFCGVHDEVDRSSTVVMESPEAGSGPRTHWFVRSSTYPVLNPSWAFHEEFALARGEQLTRRYRITVADGAWDAARITDHLERHPF